MAHEKSQNRMIAVELARFGARNIRHRTIDRIGYVDGAQSDPRLHRGPTHLWLATLLFRLVRRTARAVDALRVIFALIRT